MSLTATVIMIYFVGGGQVWKANTGHDFGCTVGTQVVSVKKVFVCTARGYWSSFVHVQRWQV